MTQLTNPGNPDHIRGRLNMNDIRVVSGTDFFTRPANIAKADICHVRRIYGSLMCRFNIDPQIFYTIQRHCQHLSRRSLSHPIDARKKKRMWNGSSGNKR
jgi:hypothetical protein